MKKILFVFAISIVTLFSYAAPAFEGRTVACTAGNLSSLASGYLTTVTSLTITGTIDARDFKTMRDAMPLLSIINLNGCTVSAYTGTAGTGGTNSIIYPANGIPTYAFSSSSASYGKESLKSFIYPSSVTTIGNSAFSHCSGMIGSLTIPSTVTIIGSHAFYYCYGLTGSLIIPSSVTNIGYQAFSFCFGFTGPLTIPSSVITIDEWAFSGCTGFTGTLTIPSSVATIGPLAFGDCRCSYSVDVANANYSSLDGVLFNKNKTRLIHCPVSKTGNYTIPSSVTTIGRAAFNDCNGLTGSLNIPSTVTTIESGAFSGCSGFTGTLTIPSSVTTISQYAFDQCYGFTGKLTIPSSVTTIESSAFQGCKGFTGTLTIPSSVTTIGGFAFSACSGLTGSLTIPSSVTTIGDYAFQSCTSVTSFFTNSTTPIDISASDDVFYNIVKTTCILYVPVGSKSLYQAANQWKDFTNIVEGVPTSLKEVSSNFITLHPNPAFSNITVSELSSLVSDKAITLSITDISGNTLLTNSIEPTLNSVTIDVGSLSSGAYVMVIQSSNGNVVKRFLKQ